MNISILKASSAILLVCVVLNAVLEYFDLLSFLSHELQGQLSYSLLLAFMVFRKLSEDATREDGPGIATASLPRFNLRQILFFATVISCLLGLAWYWPLPATAIGGTFVLRTFSTIRTMWPSVKDSFWWAFLSAFAYLIIRLDPLKVDEFILAVLVGAVLGDLLATAIHKLREGFAARS